MTGSELLLTVKDLRAQLAAARKQFDNMAASARDRNSPVLRSMQQAIDKLERQLAAAQAAAPPSQSEVAPQQAIPRRSKTEAPAPTAPQSPQQTPQSQTKAKGKETVVPASVVPQPPPAEQTPQAKAKAKGKETIVSGPAAPQPQPPQQTPQSEAKAERNPSHARLLPGNGQHRCNCLVRGTLQIDEAGEMALRLDDGTLVPARPTNYRVRAKLEDVPPQEEMVWRCYPRIKYGKLYFLNLKGFQPVPDTYSEQWTLVGVYQLREGKGLVVVQRDAAQVKNGQYYIYKVSPLGLDEMGLKPGRLYHYSLERQGETIVATRAERLSLPETPAPKPEASSESAPATPIAEGSIEMTAIGRTPELTVKFTGFPDTHPEPGGGKQQVMVVAGDWTITAVLKNKSFNRFKSGAESYADWIGSLSGQIARIEGNTIALEAAALQCFERKPKDQSAEEVA